MILLGNTYPLSLIRQPVHILPATLDELKHRATSEGFLSFWGHDNTRAAVTIYLGFDPLPLNHRPAITLSPGNLPTLNGHTFTEVWVLSPDYIPGFRPQTGTEVTPEQITSWQVLLIHFSPPHA